MLGQCRRYIFAPRPMPSSDYLAQQAMEAFAFLLELFAFGEKTTSNRSNLALQRSRACAMLEQETWRRRCPITVVGELVRHRAARLVGKSHLDLESHDVEFG